MLSVYWTNMHIYIYIYICNYIVILFVYIYVCVSAYCVFDFLQAHGSALAGALHRMP